MNLVKGQLKRIYKAFKPNRNTILSLLKSSLGIDAEGYQHHEVFWNDHGTEALNEYEISVEVDEVEYRPLGHEMQAAGSDCYFHKQEVYKDEKELRIVLQVQLGARQRFNYPYAFSNIPDVRDNAEMNDLILQFWEDTWTWVPLSCVN